MPEPVGHKNTAVCHCECVNGGQIIAFTSHSESAVGYVYNIPLPVIHIDNFSMCTLIQV